MEYLPGEGRDQDHAQPGGKQVPIWKPSVGQTEAYDRDPTKVNRTETPSVKERDKFSLSRDGTDGYQGQVG